MRKTWKKIPRYLLSLLLVGSASSVAFATNHPEVSFVENKDGFASPTRVSWTSSNNIVLTDTAEERVVILDSGGSRVGTIKDSGVPRGLKVLPDGSILVGYTSDAGGYVSQFTAGGVFVRRLGAGVGQFTMPTSIAHDPSTGEIYVADSVRNYVYRFSSTGAFLSRFNGGGTLVFNGTTAIVKPFDYPAGVAFDSARNEVIVADQGSFRIRIYDRAGQILRQFGSAPGSFGVAGGQLSKIQGISVDSESRVYVADSYQCRIQVFSSVTGAFLAGFGSLGNGAGELHVPIDVSVFPDGRVVVADWNNNRLSIWQVGLTPPPPPPPPAPNTAPTMPSPVSPADATVLTSLSPTLSSTASTDAEGHAIRYEFQVASNASFTGAAIYTSATTSVAAGPLANATTYYWRVRAIETTTSPALSSIWSASRSFTVNASNSAPAVPSPSSPAEGASIATLTPTLSSTVSTDPEGHALRYEFQVATNATFTSGLATFTSSTASVTAAALADHTTYYWRVRAAETSTPELLTSAWSAARSFNVAVANRAPSAPSAVSPAEAAVLTTLTPVLSSTTSTDPDGHAIRYEFQVAQNSSFTGATVYNSSATSVTTGTLADHATYYWRVRAAETTTSPALTSAWSSTRSFSVAVANRAPSTPTGLSPAAGTTVTGSDILSWSTSTDPDVGDTVSYVVELSDQASFSSILETKGGLTSTSVSVSDFATLTGGSYHWRVKAVDNRSASSGFAASSFSYGITGATLQVTSNPTGALVYVGGNYGYLGAYKGQTGSSPLSISVEPGTHMVRIVRNGFYPFYGTYTVAQGQTQTINVSLTSSYSYSLSEGGNLRAGGEDIGDKNPSFSYSAPFAVDWDNDGRKDLIVGDGNGRVHYYRNTNTDSSPSLRYERVVVDTGNGASPFVVDWNNDGKKDLIVGTRSGGVLLYINYGTDSSPFFSGGVPLQGGGSVINVGSWAGPAVVDWNNDTRKDLVVGDGSGYVRVFLNTGTDASPVLAGGSYISAGSGALRVSGPLSPLVFDFNNDGRKDLVVGTNRGVYIYYNNGSDASPSFGSRSNLPGTDKMSDVSYAVPFMLYWNNSTPYELLVGQSDGRIKTFRR